MNLDTRARYLKSHEWARQEGDVVVVGISDHAQETLGDVVYLDLPEVGSQFSQGEIFGVVESVKAASDLYAPVGGEVVAVNEALVKGPEAVNKDCYGSGWLVKLKPSHPEEWADLLSAADYQKGL